MIMETFLRVVIWLLVIKILIGFHWPWEEIVKVKHSLQQNLDSVRDCIPQETYVAMRHAIDDIC